MNGNCYVSDKQAQRYQTRRYQKWEKENHPSETQAKNWNGGEKKKNSAKQVKQQISNQKPLYS